MNERKESVVMGDVKKVLRRGVGEDRDKEYVIGEQEETEVSLAWVDACGILPAAVAAGSGACAGDEEGDGAMSEWDKLQVCLRNAEGALSVAMMEVMKAQSGLKHLETKKNAQGRANMGCMQALSEIVRSNVESSSGHVKVLIERAKLQGGK